MLKIIVVLLGFCVPLTVCGLFGNTTEADCNKLNGSDCQTCVQLTDCGYCPKNKLCFLRTSTINNPCTIDEQKFVSCIGNLKIWIIIISVIAGIALLTLLIIICCICRKCKRRTVRKEERRQDRQDQQMAERQTAADARTNDRNRVADQLRMKYGILKAGDTANTYSSMS